MIGLSQEDIDAKEKDPEHFAVAVVDAAAKKKKKNKGKKTLTDKLSAEDATETATPDEIARTVKGKDKVGKSDVKKADKTIGKLYKKALKARENAYVPFSKFKVGAAVLTKSGDIFTGCNIENSSFGLTVCAERVAIFNAAASGIRPGEIKMLLVAADTDDVTSPCGACRQVMAEFEIPHIIMANVKGDLRKVTLEELLPFGFKAADFT
ncbi:MAG: cytidine deaminase [Acidaminococcaceae bacterium]|nr:cytidine deaminase [Acidaminococcaceae bacterium]